MCLIRNRFMLKLIEITAKRLWIDFEIHINNVNLTSFFILFACICIELISFLVFWPAWRRWFSLPKGCQRFSHSSLMLTWNAHPRRYLGLKCETADILVSPRWFQLLSWCSWKETNCTASYDRLVSPLLLQPPPPQQVLTIKTSPYHQLITVTARSTECIGMFVLFILCPVG